MIWVALLIIHGLVAFLLIGALTHQAVSVVGAPGRKGWFVRSFASVRSAHYVNAVVALFIVTFFFGGWIYSSYRTDVRPALEATRELVAIGLFELKEHYVAIAFGLLPTYWLLWKRMAPSEAIGTRRAVTILIAVAGWGAFLVGHILNNVRGLGI